MKLVEIKTIEIKPGRRNVYDIEVEDSHQYFANGYLVHNCISACNTSIYYPMATLLDEINNIREEREHNGLFCTKVIADGGIGWFDDIQKSIALGADAVMTGRLFNECEEACEPYYWAANENDFISGLKISKNAPKWHKRYREYYGMSTKIAQKLTGGDGNKTSEGINRPTEVKYPVAKFIDNLTANLRSCMSYADSFTIEDFRKKSELIILGGSGDVTYRK